jgi:hypothetical protein
MAILGNNTVGAVDDLQTAEMKQVYKVTPGEGGTITKLSGYISGQGSGVGNQAIKAVIYTDNSGVPGNLLAVSDEVIIIEGSAYAWRDFTVSCAISSGIPIWIGYHGGAITLGSQLKAFSGSGVKFNTDTYSNGPNDPFQAASTSTNYSAYSLYATYTPVGPSIPPSTAYGNAVLADNPLTYYRMDAPSGTVEIDRGSLALDGTYLNTPTLGVTGAVLQDTAVQFDRTSGELLRGHEHDGYSITTTGALTLECWVKSSTVAPSGVAERIFGKVDNSQWEWLIERYNTGQHVCRIYTLANWFPVLCEATFGNPTLNVWHHHVVTIQNTAGTCTVKTYLDKVLTDTKTFSFASISNGVAPIEIACAGNAFTFNGAIDEVAIYDHALTATRIGIHYDTAALPLAPTVPFKGISVGYFLDRADAQQQLWIDEVKAAGCQIVRFDLNHLIFSRVQAVVNRCVNSGMPAQVIFKGPHDTTSINNNLDLMAPWLRDHGIQFWEFHNEPNQSSGSWGGNPDPAAYTAALKIFTPKLKSIDPNAYVIIGAFSGAADVAPTYMDMRTFFQAMIDAGLSSSDFDAVSVHCYGGVDLTGAESPWRKAWGTTPSIRQKLDTAGWTLKRIWNNEGGGGPGSNVTNWVNTINQTNTHFRRTDLGPLGTWMIYTVDDAAGYSELWPDGIRNEAGDAYASIQIPGSTIALAEFTTMYQVRALSGAALIPIYHIEEPTGIGPISADFSSTYDVVGRKIAQFVVVYNVHSGVTPVSSATTLVEEVRMPTDLDSFAQRLYDKLDPVLTGER